MNNKDKCAFPISNVKVSSQYDGLTKRELLSAIIAQGVCASPKGWFHPETVAKASIEIADELLKQLEK